ncbi:MAG: type II toxin-antitoxin system RelE/ParE family toxin, partial [Thermoanaerobaculia bacterium]
MLGLMSWYLEVPGVKPEKRRQTAGPRQFVAAVPRVVLARIIPWSVRRRPSFCPGGAGWVVREDAVDDLERICDYIAESRPESARRVAQSVVERISVQAFPRIGRPGRVVGTREVARTLNLRVVGFDPALSRAGTAATNSCGCQLGCQVCSAAQNEPANRMVVEGFLEPATRLERVTC